MPKRMKVGPIPQRVEPPRTLPFRTKDPSLVNELNFAPVPREKVYSLHRTHSELFFVNHSKETLTEVTVSTNGSLLTSEDPVSFLVSDDKLIRYEAVESGESVLLENYTIGDGDWFIRMSIRIRVASQSRGTMEFQVWDKGGPESLVLLYEDGGSWPSVTVGEWSQN